MSNLETGHDFVTYSIVALDKGNGDMGVAVQSHFFGAGRFVTWGAAGVGVVATQSIVKTSYGPEGLSRMEDGESPSTALQKLLSMDDGRVRRQVAMLNKYGDVAVHTGNECIGAAGHHVGGGVCAQSNLVVSYGCSAAMVAAFEESSGDLSERLMAALYAAEVTGGDLRGRQSAAMLIVRGVATGDLSYDRKIDLRVDDSTDPLGDLDRLIRTERALSCLLRLLNEPGLFVGALTASADIIAAAEAELLEGQEVLGQSNMEPTLWLGFLYARMGLMDRSLSLLSDVLKSNSHLPILLKRLGDAGLWNRSIDELDKFISEVV